MTASSHHPFGFHVPGPMPAAMPLRQVPAMQAAVTPAVPAPLVSTAPEPLFPMCAVCGNRRDLVPRGQERYRSGAQVLVCGDGCEVDPVQAAAGVIGASMNNGAGTPREWAQAQYDSGLLFDPKRAKDIEAAAREQERAEMRAELEAAAEAAEAADWFHERWLATAPLQEGCKAVHRLCDGRPGYYHLPVDAVLGALDGRQATTDDRPLKLTWDGMVAPPAGDRPGEKTLVGCETTFGARAVLELDDAQRRDLAELFLATIHPAEACATPGCGLSADDLDTADPTVWGWICVDVAGSEQGPRWWCNPLCASAAMTAAGAELAAADRAAAIDPRRQAPGPLYGGNVEEFISDAYDSLADMEADTDAVEDAPETIPFVPTPGTAAGNGGQGATQ
ncbi:hypothetical protein E4N62_46670 [Streptomyces sp. MNU76]|uniref:hypothetical protein n=1 Tax=Streptomyces sp. MNU76 TaxID=2560026 RepID=UPI001E4F8BF2|nr:hypothetical protein [Streptomyces sp. MNU76]MCC9712041.1 hypothetical protein [Streptomyces sp. MNU76]